MSQEGFARIHELLGDLPTTAETQPVIVGAAQSAGISGKATYTDTTAADVIAAQGGSTKVAVMAVLVTNAHASTGTKVEIRDGTTVKIQGYAVSAGGGFAMSGGGRPLFVGSANTAITARCVTTGADVDVFVAGYTTT